MAKHAAGIVITPEELKIPLTWSDDELGAHVRLLLQQKEHDHSLELKKARLDDFEGLWVMFQRYGVRTVALRYWCRLSDAQKNEVLEAAPFYVKHTCVAGSDPRLKFRMHLEGYLNPGNKKWTNRFWELLPKPQGPAAPSTEIRTSL